MKRFFTPALVLAFWAGTALTGSLFNTGEGAVQAASRPDVAYSAGQSGVVDWKVKSSGRDSKRKVKKARRGSFFKKLFKQLKWKKSRTGEKSRRTGHWALYTLLGGAVMLILGLAISIGILFLVGTLALIASVALGSNAAKYSEGRDQQLGRISKTVAILLLVLVLVLIVAALIILATWFSSF